MAKIWAIADLHLAIAVPSKDMALFGPIWEGYMEKIAERWREKVASEDLVLIAGDISWALRFDEALIDLRWIDALPGSKILIKGNHDYWWGSAQKMAQKLPSSLRSLHSGAIFWRGVAIGGTRLWETEEYRFDQWFDQIAFTSERKQSEEDRKIFFRELERLRSSLASIGEGSAVKLAMLHYPPIGGDLAPSKAAALLEAYGVSISLFGHLHSISKSKPLFGTARGVKYQLVSADYLNFSPLLVWQEDSEEKETSNST